MDPLSKSYQILGLEAGASPEQVKQAYRDLVTVWHPDRFSHDERLRQIAQNKLKEIRGAYEVLKAGFFESSITSSAGINPEAEPPAAEATEALPKSTGTHITIWLVLIFSVCALIGAGVFFWEKRGARKTTSAPPSKQKLAVNQTNGPVNAGTNFTRKAGVINHPNSHALAFDGNQSHVDFATTGSLTGTFTVECWALTRRVGAVEMLVNSRGPQEYGFDLKFAGNKIHGDIGDGTRWLTTTADVPCKYLPDWWYHIAYVVTPGHYMIYVDGVLSASKDDLPGNPILYDAGHPLRIAMLNPRGEPLKGLISEMRIWQTACSAAQIRANMYRSLTGTEAGLQGYWRFNEGAGTTVTDGSGHGISGTLSGDVTWATNAPPVLFP